MGMAPILVRIILKQICLYDDVIELDREMMFRRACNRCNRIGWEDNVWPCLQPHVQVQCVASKRQNASAGNRARVTSMAAMYSTNRPLMLLMLVLWHQSWAIKTDGQPFLCSLQQRWRSGAGHLWVLRHAKLYSRHVIPKSLNDLCCGRRACNGGCRCEGMGARAPESSCTTLIFKLLWKARRYYCEQLRQQIHPARIELATFSVLG